MAERLNRDPTYDLARHIVTGEPVPLSGEPSIRQYDAELDRNDPMDSFTAGVGSGTFVGQSDADIQQQNLTQAMGMQTGAGQLGQPVDMDKANDWSDDPSKATDLAYGPSNTDSERDSRRGGY